MTKTVKDLSQVCNPLTVNVSSTLDVTNAITMSLTIAYCQLDISAQVTSGPTIRIEGRRNVVGLWSPIATWEPKIKLPSRAKISATAPPQSTTLSFSSVPTDWVRGQQYMLINVLDPTGTPSYLKWEFVRLGSLVSPVQLEEPTTFNRTNIVTPLEECYLYNNVDFFVAQLNVASLLKIRVITDGSRVSKKFLTSIVAVTLNPS